MKSIERMSSLPPHEIGKDNCVFCEIFRGNGEVSKIAEYRSAVAIMDLHDYPLIVPKEHITEFSEETKQTFFDVYELAHRMEVAIRTDNPKVGVTLLTNRGKSAGQEIPHFHLHAIIQSEEERKIRYLNAPLLDRQTLDVHASKLQEVYNRIYTTSQNLQVTNSGR